MTALTELRETPLAHGHITDPRAIIEQILNSADYTRTDRLWPADPIVFQTNPLNVAYGACGTALFLHDVLGELPPRIREWLLARPVDASSYPPGLYSGIAGVAWTFAMMGLEERAGELFRLIPESPLAFKAYDMFNGASGWGLAALARYVETGDGWYLNLAGRAGDYLLANAQRDEHGAFWRDEDGIVRLGFGLGGSGIALFLLYLGKTSGETRYVSAAREAMDFEIAKAQHRGGAMVWGATPDIAEHRPYWLRGGAGVASALIRFGATLHEQYYSGIAAKAARGCAAFFSVAPHLFEGLASMGETLLDMYQATGEQHYLDLARQKAEQIMLYRIDSRNGIAFPGRYLLRISNDYGMGSAGIGLYFHRLTGQRPRRFHDIFAPASAFAAGPGRRTE
ncbi:MAG: lanthionine synthetase C family protein [Bryobacterales bacterium]|nr:lanthionine synthetase C family protein [Bryobacterales bacterium]